MMGSHIRFQVSCRRKCEALRRSFTRCWFESKQQLPCYPMLFFPLWLTACDCLLWAYTFEAPFLDVSYFCFSQVQHLHIFAYICRIFIHFSELCWRWSWVQTWRWVFMPVAQRSRETGRDLGSDCRGAPWHCCCHGSDRVGALGKRRGWRGQNGVITVILVERYRKS